jgi:hypothetical protein
MLLTLGCFAIRISISIAPAAEVVRKVHIDALFLMAKTEAITKSACILPIENIAIFNVSPEHGDLAAHDQFSLLRCNNFGKKGASVLWPNINWVRWVFISMFRSWVIEIKGVCFGVARKNFEIVPTTKSSNFGFSGISEVTTDCPSARSQSFIKCYENSTSHFLLLKNITFVSRICHYGSGVGGSLGLIDESSRFDDGIQSRARGLASFVRQPVRLGNAMEHFVRKAISGRDGTVSLCRSALQFMQLTTHGVPLQESGYEREGSYCSENIGGDDKAAGNRYKRGLVGLLVVGIGLALLRLAMEIFYKANEAPRLYLAGAACLLAALALIIHGGFYAFIGQWALTGLYIL